MLFSYYRRQMRVLLSPKQIQLCCFFFFFGQSMVFVNSPATSTWCRYLEKKNTIPPSCPCPHWVRSVHKPGRILSTLVSVPVTRWGNSQHFTFPAPKQTEILKETENNSSGNELISFPRLVQFVEISCTSDLFKTSNWLILAIISCLRVSGFFSVSMKGLLWHCSDRKLGSLSSSLIDDHWNGREQSFEETQHVISEQYTVRLTFPIHRPWLKLSFWTAEPSTFILFI